ncbi:Tex family protein [Candidatus Parabeggiatoa sp. HSG14]|uniref:Tex family protein n=1 Tax=Candidatus Parabeggiatoa sp. HSG14 TaxID=3055593 RepID=UPI0025A6C4F6|nr:Tex family protein [Thiotrichales bacterium HSG14]
MKTIVQRIAEEISVQESQVQAAVFLLDEGATVPFIARYRKEVTGGLDDTQLRTLEERLRYLRELNERREVILNSIRDQEKLIPELEVAILEADTKTRLEDLYLPYKPKRRSKAKSAREAGLEPLALDLFQNPTLVPEEAAVAYINTEKGIDDAQKALEGARHILMEKFAENAELLGELREYLWENAICNAKVVDGKQEKGAKFTDYFDYHEPLKEVPSHRALALFRGRKESVLQLSLSVESPEDTDTEEKRPHYCETRIAIHFKIEDQDRPADSWLLETVRSAWRFKIRSHLDAELLTRVRETAENEAIKVFASNLHDLLLAAPAGPRATIGLDPGLRTGVKIAVIDKTGKLLETANIYPHAPRKQWQRSLSKLAELARKHEIELISIGNGTGSRETDKLVSDLIKQNPDLHLHKMVVSEAGASVYSASKLAKQEFPDLDVSIRGAVSIARRLQDPLAELVKIEPKSIGVGQYQHDVNKNYLARSLESVVEDCVNAVGVDINTASVSLLSRVSGLNNGLARNIVAFRDEHGAFINRDILKEVPRLGEKSFEQAAGFLRIMNGNNPLDVSSVHPEAYPVIERIVAKTEKPIQVLIGDTEFLRNLKPEEYIDETFGIPTVTDILRELEKPGRDPRPEFKTPSFKEGVENLEDLEADLVLEGIVTNVTNFGAFVDIGVHQDGLVHISAMSNTYVKDPRNVVKAGNVVKVKVLEVDLKRRRVALTMCLEEKPAKATNNQKKDNKDRNNRDNDKERNKRKSKKPRTANKKPASSKAEQKQPSQPSFVGSIMAEAFANARKG